MAAKKTLKASPTNNSSLMLLALACAVLITSYFLFVKVSRETAMTNMQASMQSGTEASMMNNKELTVQLNEQNNSGEYGNALLIEKDGVVHVHVSIKNAPKGISQPAHIHVGTCIDIGAVQYPLTNLVNGLSDTTLQVSLKDLLAQGPLALNVHKSVPQAKQYVSCGNL